VHALDQNLWQTYAEWVARQATGGRGCSDREYFAVSSLLLTVALGNVDARQDNWTIFGLGNVVPAQQGTYSPAGSFWSAYWVFLAYAIAGLQQQPLSDAARPCINPMTDLGQLSTDYQAALVRWLGSVMAEGPGTQPLNQPVTPGLHADLASPVGIGGAGLDPIHNDVLAGLQGLGVNEASELASALEACRQAGHQAPSAYSMPCLLGGVTEPVSTPAYALEGYLKALAAWRVPGDPPTPLSSVVVLDGAADDLGNAGESPAPPLGPDLAHLPFLNSHQAGDTTVASAGLSRIKIGFRGLGSFDITPGPWYQEALLACYAKEATPGAPTFFGEGGILALLPRAVVLGFGPSVELITDDTESCRALANSVRSVGPLRITDASGPAHVCLAETADTRLVYAAEADSLPVLLGVLCERMPPPLSPPRSH
jgi:hypothetical protein